MLHMIIGFLVARFVLSSIIFCSGNGFVVVFSWTKEVKNLLNAVLCFIGPFESIVGGGKGVEHNL